MEWLYFVIAYLLGSIPSAVLICSWLSLPDPRHKGSGNPGTTNVLRTGSRKAALLTLFADMGKGGLAVLIPIFSGVETATCGWIAATVIVGHTFPILNGLKGGKGVATTFGAFVILAPELGLAQLSIWLFVITIRRISSLASISAATLSPIACWLFVPAIALPVTLISALLLIRHSDNIIKLIDGQESRL